MRPFSAIAFLFSLTFLLTDTVLSNEAGQTGSIDGYLLGYWLWVGSFFIQLTNSWISYRYPEKKQEF